MSAVPLEGDLILRPLGPIESRRFALVDAVTMEVRYGPFENLGDAVLKARDLAAERPITIWQEHVDDRGRSLGPLRTLFGQEA